MKFPTRQICLALSLIPLITGAQDHTLVFSTNDPGISKSIDTWGMDTTWANPDNMRSGIANMGLDQIDVVRVGFMVNKPLGAGDVLDPALKSRQDDMRNVAALAGTKPWLMMPDTEGGVDAYYKNGSEVRADRWVAAMAAAKRYYGKTMLWTEPFNEPDYGPWNQGTQANLNDIMGRLGAHADFQATGIAGASTLNCSNANNWYNEVKSHTAVGTTHCLGGSFDDYVSWMQNVRASGDVVLNPEVHNLMEVIAGAEYGLQGAIWWGSCSQTRGQFVKSCQGKRLAYSEDRARWTAAAVYRAPDNVIRCFVGGSERMGVATTYKFVCADRDVFFNSQGPMREFTMTAIPDKDGFVEVRWEDAPPDIDGKYVIAARHSGKVMEIAGGGTGNGANARQATYTGATYQKWDVLPKDGIFKKLLNANSAKSLEIVGFSTADGGNAQQWGAGENWNMNWFFEYADNGYFYIRNRFSGKYLEVAGASTAENANIAQWSGLGAAHQQWKFFPAGYWTKVDDTGAGVSYGPNWGTYVGNPGYQNTEHFQNTSGGEVTYTFTGSQARYYGFKRSDLGMAEIRVDDVLKSTVDCYSATGAFDQLLYQTDMLPVGTHTLKVRAAGTKNAASSGVSIIADAFSKFTDTPVDFIAPSPPAGLTAVAGSSSVALTWTANPELDVTSYTVLRATAPGGPYQIIALGNAANSFNDTKVFKGTTYYYAVKAADASTNLSGLSAEVVATPGGPAGLIARYLFDGDSLDVSGNANHATRSGSPVFTTGKTGQALAFDGVDDFVTLPVAAVNFNDITICTWVKWNGGANWQRIFDFGNDTAFNLYLSPKTSDGKLRFGIRDGAGEQTLNAPPLIAGQWTHVAVTLQGDVGKLYVNGVLADTQTITYNPSYFGPANVWLGKSQWPDPLLTGSLDDFRIYNLALSGAQLASIAQPAPPVFAVDPIVKPAADQLVAYAGQTISGSATDPNGDTVTYSKVGGPAWLTVSASGILSGTPAATNAGLNSFTVAASDGTSSTQATLQITVHRATYTLSATDPSGTSSFTVPLTGGATGWPGVAAAGNDYIVSGDATSVAMRGPVTGNATFPGDSLTLLPNGRLLLKTGATAVQTLTAASLILNGGVLDLANATNSGSAATLAGAINLGPNSGAGGVGALTGETLTISAAISGSGPLVVSGSSVNSGADQGTVILTGAVSYSGSTSVKGGTLSLKSATLADTAAVSITAPGVLNLDHVGTDIVGSLTFGGVLQPDGIYGSANSSGRITGSGKLQVGTSGYAIWAAAYAAGQTADGDADGDGVANGVEYFMGANSPGFTANPSVVNGTVTWPKSTAFVGGHAIQISTNLASWAYTTQGVVETADSVTFTLPPDAGGIFVRLKVVP